VQHKSLIKDQLIYKSLQLPNCCVTTYRPVDTEKVATEFSSLIKEFKMNPVEHIDGVVPFPEGFDRKDIKTDDVTIHTRIGGRGPAVVMLHGFGTTGEMWAPVARALVGTHTVIAPDLRGLGLSSKPSGGYDKKTQSGDIAHVLDVLGV